MKEKGLQGNRSLSGNQPFMKTRENLLNIHLKENSLTAAFYNLIRYAGVLVRFGSARFFKILTKALHRQKDWNVWKMKVIFISFKTYPFWASREEGSAIQSIWKLNTFCYWYNCYVSAVNKYFLLENSQVFYAWNHNLMIIIWHSITKGIISDRKID